MTNKTRLALIGIGVAFLILLGLASSLAAESNTISSSELGYSSYSPNGLEGGELMPASCESGLYEGGYAHRVGDTGIPYSSELCPSGTPTPSLELPTPYLWWDPYLVPYNTVPTLGWTSSPPAAYCDAYIDGAQWTRQGASFSSLLYGPMTANFIYAVQCYNSSGGPGPFRSSLVPVGPEVTQSPPMCPCSSAANACGLTNPGMTVCGTSCPVPPPNNNSCPLPGINPGYTTISPTNPGGNVKATPEIDQNGNPTNRWIVYNEKNSQTVNRGDRCTIYWDATPATSCTVTGPGVSSSGKSGMVQTPRIGVDTIGSAIYTITCYNGPVVSSTAKFSCRLNPEYEEVR